MKTINEIRHENYLRFSELFPDIMSGRHQSEQYESKLDIFDPISLENTIEYGDSVYIMSAYRLNGDLIFAPCITAVFDRENQTLTAKACEESLIGRYDVYEENSEEQQACDERLYDWLGQMEKMQLVLTAKSEGE